MEKEFIKDYEIRRNLLHIQIKIVNIKIRDRIALIDALTIINKIVFVIIVTIFLIGNTPTGIYYVRIFQTRISSIHVSRSSTNKVYDTTSFCIQIEEIYLMKINKRVIH